MNGNTFSGSVLRVIECRTNSPSHPIRRKSSISFDSGSGTLLIKGSCRKSDLHDYYFPIRSQIQLYLKENKLFSVGIFLSEIGNRSARVLFDLFKLLSQSSDRGIEYKVKWFLNADDYELMRTAQDYEELYTLNSEMVLSRDEYL